MLLGPIPPFLLKTGDNPEGVDQSVFDGLIAAARADRYAYFKDFFDNFYNVDKFRGTRISDQAGRRASTSPPVRPPTPAWPASRPG